MPQESILSPTLFLLYINNLLSTALTMNIDKTNYLLIQTHQSKFTIVKSIKMNHMPLVQVAKLNFLGVVINETMNWKAHIQ